MDNQFSQVSISVPEIPADFEARAGSSKTDLASAILLLISAAQVNGIDLSQPNNFDLAQIQNRLTAVEASVEKQQLNQRTVGLTGIANGLLTIPFDDMPSTNYWVNLIFITTNTNLNTVTWGLITGSKQTNQCQVRIDGDASPYQIEVQILENKS